jgi:uncharacterized lipoprotein YddW (UPF0748 family)
MVLRFSLSHNRQQLPHPLGPTPRKAAVLATSVISVAIALSGSWPVAAQAGASATKPNLGVPKLFQEGPHRPTPAPSQVAPKPTSPKPANPQPASPKPAHSTGTTAAKPPQTGAAGPIKTAQAIASHPEIRGVWMTTNDTDVLRDRTLVAQSMAKLARLNFNTVYPVVWNSGYVMYPSAVGDRRGIPFVHKSLSNPDPMAEIVSQAKRNGLLVMPWFEFGLKVPTSSELAMNHPEWLSQKRDGSLTSDGETGEVAFLNPAHPEVQQFLTDLVVETVARYDVDGIQFDDHMGLPVAFGYDPYTLALYQKETGKSAPANPQDQAWMKWRADKLTALMRKISQAVKAQKPNAIVSISPNYYDFAYKLYLQDWLTWVRQGIVDELVVQVYRSDMNGFVDLISRPEIREAQQKIPTAIGVLTGVRHNPVPMAQVEAQVQAARERGLGVSFFYYNSLWGKGETAERQTRLKALFPERAQR